MRIVAMLDPPGETKRQLVTLLVWLFFLGTAVIIASGAGVRLPASVDPLTADPGSEPIREELQRSRSQRLRIALFVGLLAPAAVSYVIARRHRAGGAHPGGITIEVTDGELRIWGRGYGSRVSLPGAKVEERLVDVYAGRLGVWRQLRLKVKSRHQEIEIAAPARPTESKDLRLDGGEADCVEVGREDYSALKEAVLARVAGGAVPAGGAS